MASELSVAERRLLLALPEDGSPRTVEEAARVAGFREPVEALRAAGGPERQGLIARTEETARTFALNEEGLRYQADGLPERRAAEAVQGNGGHMPLAGLKEALRGAEVSVAVGWLRRKGWADIRKDDGVPSLVLKDGLPLPGPDEEALGLLGVDPRPDPGHEGIALLARRGGLLVQEERTVRRLALTAKGRRVAASLDAETVDQAEEWNEVTPERLARWEAMSPEERGRVRLRPFDVAVEVAPRHPAKPHPLTQIMDEVRRLFHGMGFKEIAGDYVESAYWNMDALFIPQDHPAREMQDTFYLERPARLPVPAEDLERGRSVHEEGGGTGSKGWGGIWDPEVARRALLRTHTTNTTVRYLAANPGGAHKVFGLGRVFRNETMDATHLPEFHQIEGIVTEEGADFDMLVGLCRVFFTRMGFSDVRLRPAYFPYTEPSMEVEVLHRGRWLELGGAGVFRPEVTQPLGVEHPVLAWGFGLERLAMERLGLADIRQLVVSDVRWLQETPLGA